ncbi:MAG: SDR family oxidoreductase [Flavobacterium sp.]|nr:MAG: SDR family oxidoreductase [Flavobacterium sp.]
MILEEKVVIVTGGSGLIGRSIMNDIQKKGGIAINADINVETDFASHQVKTDITSPDSIKEVIRSIIGNYGRIDGLVNNAYPRTSDWGNKFEDIRYESWCRNVDFQLNSVFSFIQHVIAELEKTKGAIVNIASIYGVVGNDLSIYEGTNITAPAAYSAIKGGVINFTRYLASYLGKRGIRVNAVSPGGIFDHQDKVFVNNYEKKVPLGRMGRPDDISPAVSFLLSEEAKYITGQNLIVDGGWTAI